MRNGNFLKICVSEIRVKRIRVNQGLGVVLFYLGPGSRVQVQVPKYGSRSRNWPNIGGTLKGCVVHGPKI